LLIKPATRTCLQERGTAQVFYLTWL